MLTTIKKIRCAMLVALTHNVALPILKRFRKVKPFPYSKEELLSMEHGTVGRDLAEFLGEKQLALLSHYARHDMKHVVLGFDTTEDGELCLQSFMFGNGRISFPVLATVLFGIFTSPEHWGKMLSAYRKGKQCAPIHTWNWFTLVPLNTLQLRNKIFTTPKTIAV